MSIENELPKISSEPKSDLDNKGFFSDYIKEPLSKEDEYKMSHRNDNREGQYSLGVMISNEQIPSGKDKIDLLIEICQKLDPKFNGNKKSIKEDLEINNILHYIIGAFDVDFTEDSIRLSAVDSYDYVSNEIAQKLIQSVIDGKNFDIAKEQEDNK